MSVENFIPELWSAKIEDRLTNGALLTGIANREYEGTLAFGNKLRVTGMDPVAVRSLAANGAEISYDEIGTVQKTFTIDQKKYAAIEVPDIDQVQVAAPGRDLIGKYTSNMAIGVLEDQETFLHAQLVAGDTSPVTGTLTDYQHAYDAVLDINQKLTSKKAPRAGRYLFINAKFERLLLAGDSKLATVDTSGSTEGLREAIIGRLSGFNVVTSQYLDNTKATAVGFVPQALSYAMQIEEVEALRAEKKFADLLRSLAVYGGKVMLPDWVAVSKEQ